MRRSLRADVPEGHETVPFVDLVGRKVARGDPAKETVGRVHGTRLTKGIPGAQVAERGLRGIGPIATWRCLPPVTQASALRTFPTRQRTAPRARRQDGSELPTWSSACSAKASTRPFGSPSCCLKWRTRSTARSTRSASGLSSRATPSAFGCSSRGRGCWTSPSPCRRSGAGAGLVGGGRHGVGHRPGGPGLLRHVGARAARQCSMDREGAWTTAPSSDVDRWHAIALRNGRSGRS